MIRFTDGKKEYVWTDDDEIIGMDEMDAEILKMSDEIAWTTDNHILRTGVLEAEGFTILEQDTEPDGVIY